MTSFTDFHCGISQPHRHTGIMHEAHYIQYWCTAEEGWVDRAGPDEKGNMPIRCRTQSTISEEIDLSGEWPSELGDIIKEELDKEIEKKMLQRFMEGT